MNQCIASHMTTMNEGGGAKGGEYGISRMKSYSTFRCVINDLATIRKTGFTAITMPT